MLKTKVLFVQLFGCLLNMCQVYSAWYDNSGPWVIATAGEPWPIPAFRQVREETYKLQPDDFSFQRYKDIILNDFQVAAKFAENKDVQPSNDDNVVYAGHITGIKIHLMSACQRYPHLNMNESYDLIVPNVNENNMAALESDSIWGILRGLETFSQLIMTSENGLSIRKQKITDYPRLPYRGLLLDTSRHYLPVEDILRTLDAMSYNKLNVLHWHIVDDNSFPYQSEKYPELSKKGAYHSTMVYTPKNMKTIVEYARLRGIRVIPEFDTPGHTRSWGLSHPEYLTSCYDPNGEPNGSLGPIDPTNKDFYSFLLLLFSEVKYIFPDTYLHIGGDEVSYDCWKSNPRINKFMKKNNISNDYKKLEELHYNQIIRAIGSMIKPIVWQEVYDNSVSITGSTVVQIWKGDWREKIFSITSDEYETILSSCWYLDHIAGGADWLKFYECDPLDFKEVFPGQKNFVLGGEACMWGEFVDRNNLHSRIWPRACAAAEKLWSVVKDDIASVGERLEEHACRMNRRGIPAQPANGPGFCVV